VKAFYAAAALATAILCAPAIADDLTASQAEKLLQPLMLNTCGTYYTEQGEPAFADLESKPMCTYVPRVTRLQVSGNTATADYNHDRFFGDVMAVAWLADYAKMEADEKAHNDSPSLLFKTLKAHLDKWRAESGGFDKADRPGRATFKLDASGWHVDSAPQD
jgi:hypothetical protein